MADDHSSSTESVPDHTSDPALDDTEGHDWSDEGGATPEGPATHVAPAA